MVRVGAGHGSGGEGWLGHHMLRQLLRRLRADRPPQERPAAPPRPSVLPSDGPSVAATQPDSHRQARQSLREAFTPMWPQLGAKRFVGRQAQLARIIQAIDEERAHVVLYAERGRGKTSLANLAAEFLRHAGYTVAHYACAAESDFEAIIRGLARDLPSPLLASPAASLEGCAAALPAGRLEPRDVVALPSRLVGRHFVFVLDEYDRVSDNATRTRFADTLKHISDRGAPISFLIVGVSDSLEQLLGRHPSIQRNVVGVPLPLLSNAEVEALVARGSQEAGLDFSSPVRACIAALARGVPYYAQLLALRAGQAALERGATAIAGPDLLVAIERTVAEADPRVIALYDTLTEGGRADTLLSLLRAIAAGTQDEFGQFRAEVAADERLYVAGTVADPALWARLLEAGAIRACNGASLGTFAFGEATLRQYVLLRTVSLLLARTTVP